MEQKFNIINFSMLRRSIITMASNIIGIWLVFMAACIFVGYAKVPEKIVGGTTADIYDLPYVVSLHVANEHFCGGSIINEEHILTSASCIVLGPGVFQTSIKVFSGSNDQWNVTGTGRIHDVALITIHEDYNPDEFWSNDIAILKLSSKLTFSPSCDIVELPVKWTEYPENVYVSGWGGIESPSSSPARLLQKLRGRVLNVGACEHFYGRFTGLHPNQRCVKTVNNFMESAMSKGDGGGPLTINNKIIGVVSISEPSLGAPVIFTKVFPYRNWIESIIGTN